MFGVIDYTFNSQKTDKPGSLASKAPASKGNFRQRAVSVDKFVGPTFRSSRGCLGCRKRRKKCDETHPRCNACVKRGLECVWRDQKVKVKAEAGANGHAVLDSSEESPKEAALASLGYYKKAGTFSKAAGEALGHSKDALEALPPSSFQHASDDLLKNDSVFEENPLDDFDNLVEVSASQLSVLQLDPNSNLFISRALSPLQMVADFNDYFIPHLPNSFFNTFLDSKGVAFVQHFDDEVSRALTVSPRTSNYFSKTFLLLANIEESISHALASWGAFYVHQHVHGDVQEHLSQAMAVTAKRYPRGTVTTTYDHFILVCLHLIVVGSLVCQGDITQWWQWFCKCGQLIQRTGGLQKLCAELDYSNDIKFLASSFFYHDVMSSHAFGHGLFFSAEEYSKVFTPGFHDLSYGIDPLQGCLNSVYLLLGKEIEVRIDMRNRQKRLDELLNEELVNEDDQTVLSEFEMMRTLFLEYCERTVKVVEMNIEDCVIDQGRLVMCNEDEIRSHSQIFAVYKLVCKIYWALYLKGIPPKSNEVQLMWIQLIYNIEKLVDSRMIVVLCLPLLIAGISCYTKVDRRRMEKVFTKVIANCPIHNVQRAWAIVQELWKRNPNGNLSIDWADVCEDFGWQICAC